METLANSSSKVFTERHKDRGFSTSRDVLIRPQICFLRKSHTPINSGFLNLIIYSQRNNPIRPLSSSSQSEVVLEDEETPSPEEPCQLKTAHVKFQLRKKCMFGEQFLIVGDDTLLGLWDPQSAIPLEWSDGHLWTLGLDIPTEKSIQYKFILKGVTGKMLWQPGPDRILQTWETNNTISVTEDWEDAGLQKIVEEEPILKHSEKSSIAQQITSIVAENIIHVEEPKPLKERDAETMAIVAENTTRAEESNSKTLYSKPLGDTKKGADLNKDVTTREILVESNDRAATLNSLSSAQVHDNLITYEGAPVLVPGLTPLTTGPAEASTDKDDKTPITADALVEKDEAKDQNEPQLNQNIKKQEPDGPPHVEATPKVVINSEYQENVSKVEQMVYTVMGQDLPKSEIETGNVLQNYIQWGQKALQRLLSNFGFL